VDSRKAKDLSPAEAARMLRELADELENGTLSVGDAGAVPAGKLRAKVSCKSKEDTASLSVKLQWRCAEPGEVPVPSPKKKSGTGTKDIPPYKSIKKSLASTFKKIRAQLREGELPDAELAELFDRDAELMFHYPGKGEPADIEAFHRIAAGFTAAVKAGDLEGAGREAAALAAAEKSCHKRFK
jgi:XXXCH domain-containing protein